LDKSRDFFTSDNDLSGQLVSQVAPPAEFPISGDLRPFSKIRWRRVKQFLGGDAVAYDLPAYSGKATLYVFRHSVTGLPSSPPNSPDQNTGGTLVAAWESGGLVYVLVVQGNDRDYAKYFNRGPLT
jgi:hypothetical protein